MKPGLFKTYRALAYTLIDLGEYQELPSGLEEKMRICATEAVLYAVPSWDYAQLDSYARGEIDASLLTEEQANVSRRLRASPQQRILRYCPDLWQKAERYRHPTVYPSIE